MYALVAAWLLNIDAMLIPAVLVRTDLSWSNCSLVMSQAEPVD